MKTRTRAALLVCLAAVAPLACGGEQAASDQETQAAAADFCAEHQIAESQCPFCNPSLVQTLGHCNGHGVPEAYCYQCNPALIPAFKAVGDWCAGHDRPESQCYICNPELDPAKQKTTETTSLDGMPPAGASSPTGALDAGRLPRIQRPPSVFCTTQDLVVRLENGGIAKDAGLELAAVERRDVSKSVTCNARIDYDANRYAKVAAQIPGVVAEVHKDFGQTVAPGDPLVTISSAHLGAAKAALLEAVESVRLWEQNHAREDDLLARGVSTEKDLLEARTHLAESRIAASSAEQRLLSLGLTAEEIEEVRRTGDTSAQHVISAPFTGVVVDRDVTVGEVVDPSRPVFAVADISRMWALLDVYEADQREIQVGQPVVVRAEGLAGESFPGRLTWVSSQVDPQTRTLRARAELDNSHGLLRANMFADATVTVRDHAPTLVVPTASVQWEGCCNVVFVKRSDAEYLPRKVHLGVSTGTFYEVLGGVSAGEQVVTQGSFLLKTEILKGSIGAGCCEVDPGA